VVDVQRLLSELQYEPGAVDGVLGRMTRAAIRKFQSDRDLPQTGEVSEALIAGLYRAAGKDDVKAGHLYVRQNHKNVFDVAVSVKDPGKPLGTHIFTALHFVKGAETTRWTAQTIKERVDPSAKARREKANDLASPPVAASTSGEALERIEIPETVRALISEMLTPGSSLIVSDSGIMAGVAGGGTDFVVRAL